jgi:DNA-directed RNA polymerase specialized sigma24 family protein
VIEEPLTDEDWGPAMQKLVDDYNIQRAQAAARMARDPFLIARKNNERLREFRAAEAAKRQQDEYRRRWEAAQKTKAERAEIYAERRAVAAMFSNPRVRRAMALTLHLQGKSHREIGDVVGCGSDRVRGLIATAQREQRRWRKM